MKRILLALTFVGTLAGCLAGFAQTSSPAADATAASVTPAKDAAPPAAAAEAAPAAQAPAPAAAANTPSTPEAPAAAATQVAANDAVPSAAAVSTPPADATPADNSANTAEPKAVIPLIVMDDVPLTDAIRNLARQAEINYMLDPKIGFGQIGADGKATPQPSVSIRWEKITAEQALTALLNNYTLQLIEDPKSKIDRITTKDPAALPQLSTRIIQLKYASPSNVVSSVQSILLDKRDKVMPDVRTSQLVVVATEPELADVDQLIQRLDTKTRQVLIEARLLETVVNPSTSKGVDWSPTLASQHVSFGNGVVSGTSSQTDATTPGTPSTTTTTLPGGRTVTTSTTPSSQSSSTASTLLNSVFGGGSGALSMDTARGLSPSTFFLNADGVKAVLSFLNTYAETKVISSPRTVTLDNETSVIEVGTQYPIVNTTAGTANTTGGSSISYSNLTVRLTVTPRISANNYVKLNVRPSVIRLGDLVTSIVGGVPNTVPSFETREINTSVMIPSGNTLVMGGLIQDNVHEQDTKVPLLGDIRSEEHTSQLPVT